MLITCPTCATSYQLDTAALGSGRSVRCARCQTLWYAAPEPELVFERVEGDAAWSQPSYEWSRPELDEPLISNVPATIPAVQPYAMDAPSVSPEGDSSLVEIDPTDVPHAPDIETAAARGPLSPKAKRHGSRGGTSLAAIACFCGIAAIAALLQFRIDVVRFAPQTAALYAHLGFDVNLRGLAFRNIKSRSEMHEGMPVLVLEGDIVNVAEKPVDVPRMRFAVRNEAGLEVYAWTAQPAQSLLGKGDVLPFRSRLASPPADTHDVVVRFFNRRDLADAGAS